MGDEAPREVVVLEERRLAPDQRIVNCLETLLAEAKAGKLTGFAYVVETPSTADCGWHGTYWSLVAGVSRLLYKLHKAMDAGKEGS